MITLREFLLARFDEDQAAAEAAAVRRYDFMDFCDHVLGYDREATHAMDDHVERWEPARVLVEVAAKREILRLHESWPVLVETPPELDCGDRDMLSAVTMRMTQQIAWLTQQEYRARFGAEPPTTPMLRALALPYAEHPDFRPEWRQ